MTKIRAVVIDDEVKSREVIKTLLESFCDNVEVVDEAGDISTGISVITTQKPDLVFLDINLKEGDSFQILSALSHINFDIIFVTAYDEYSVKALQFSGITCLFKPLDIDELQEAVKEVALRPTDMGLAYEMVNGILKSKFKRLPIITTSGLKFADVSDITYIIDSENGVTVHFRNGEAMESKRKLEEFADVIVNTRFAKLGSRIMVNTIHLEAHYLSGNKLHFRNGDVVTIEKDEASRLKQLMQ